MLIPLLAVLLGTDPAAPPGPPLLSPFARAVFEAYSVVELEVPLDPKLKPTPRWAKGLAQAKPVRLVATRGLDDLPKTFDFQRWEVLRSCLALTDGRASVKVLLVMTGSPPKPAIFSLATMGFAMESTPGYPQLTAAIEEAFRWHEERMRAVSDEQLWQEQKKALLSDNPYLRHLAAEFLAGHDAAKVVDALWGAPGTEQRAKSEAASRVVPECKPPGRP